MSFFKSCIVLFFQVDEKLDELILRIKLREGNTEFLKYLFRGDWFSESYAQQSKLIDRESIDVVYDNDVVDDLAKLTEDDEAEDEEAQMRTKKWSKMISSFFLFFPDKLK